MKTAILIFFTLISASCGAGELQAEYGQCRLGQSKDGDFWQSGKATSNHLTTPCASLGLAGKFGASRWGWGLAFIATGTFESSGNVATFRDDEAGHNFSPSDCQDNGRGCMTVHHGSGDLKGIRVKLTRSFDLGNHLEAIPEMGLLFNRIFWRDEADWYGSSPARFCTNAECVRLRSQPELPGNYDHSEWKDVFRAAPSLSPGITLRYRQVYLSLRRDIPMGGRPLSLTDGSMTELMIGVALPLAK